MAIFDPFNINGGGSTATVPTNYTGGSSGKGAKANAGRVYDPFNIGSVTAVANPNIKPIAQKPVQQPQPKSQSLLGKLGSAAKDVAVGTKNFAEAGVKSAYDIGRGAAASGSIPGIKENPTALANAHKAKETDFPTFAAPLTRPLVQLGETIRHPLSATTGTAKTKSEQEILGKQPIQNIQAGVKGNYDAHANLSPVKRTLLAAGYGAGQVAQDALAVTGLKSGAIDDIAHTAGKVSSAVKTVTGKDEAVNTALQTAKQNTLLDAARKPIADQVHDEVQKRGAEFNVTGKPATEEVKPVAQPVVEKGNTSPEAPTLKPAEMPMATKEPAEFAKTYLENNKAQAEKDYATRTRQEFGNTKNNIVSGDEAKFIIPGFGPDKSVPYHEAASAFAKEHYANLLKDPATKDKDVMIMAGGSGAGKSSSLREVLGKEEGNLDNYAAVVDTNLGDMKGAESRIGAARASGRNVAINYVYRDPEDAYMNGVVPRAARTGRIVTPVIHADTHAGSFDTIFKLAEKYKDDPHVAINAVDNSRGIGKQAVVPLDFLKDKGYTKEQIELKIHQKLDEALQHNKLTKDAYHELKGTSQPNIAEDLPTKVAGDSPTARSEPVAQRSSRTVSSEAKESQPTKPVTKPEPKVEQGTSKVAERVAKDIKGQYGDLAQYDKITIKDQAQKATTLLSDRAKLDRVVSGEDPLPQGLRATSVITAVRSDPVLSKDSELLRQLANSDLASESSYSAQELRLARENAKLDPVEAIKGVQKARATALEAKTGKTAAKAISTEVKQIRATVPKVSRQSWGDFIESIKC